MEMKKKTNKKTVRGHIFTWRIWLASKAVPGKRITGVDTCPASTQSMFGYSSSPRSPISRAWSDHGFHITVEMEKMFRCKVEKSIWWKSSQIWKNDFASILETIEKCLGKMKNFIENLPVSGKLYFCNFIFLPDTTLVIMCSCGVCW